MEIDRRLEATSTAFLPDIAEGGGPAEIRTAAFVRCAALTGEKGPTLTDARAWARSIAGTANRPCTFAMSPRFAAGDLLDRRGVSATGASRSGVSCADSMVRALLPAPVRAFPNRSRNARRHETV